MAIFFEILGIYKFCSFLRAFGTLSLLANIKFRDAMWKEGEGSYYIIRDDVLVGMEHFLLDVYEETALIM